MYVWCTYDLLTDSLTHSECEDPLASCSRSPAAPQSSACTFKKRPGRQLINKLPGILSIILQPAKSYLASSGCFRSASDSPFLHEFDRGLAEQVVGQQIHLPHGVGQTHRQLLSQEHIGRFLTCIFPALKEDTIGLKKNVCLSNQKHIVQYLTQRLGFTH